MSEETKIPELVLETAAPAAPDFSAAATAAAAAVPELKLNTDDAAEPAAEPADNLTLDALTPEEQAVVRDFASKIDIADSAQVLAYGSNAQKNISDFSAQALNTVRTKDLGATGQMLTNLVAELKGLEATQEGSKGLRKIFKKAQKSISDLKSKYDKAEVNVDNITQMLEQHCITLNKDVVTLDKMYELNQAYFKELSMYIIAGKLRLEELRATELPKYVERAQQSGLPEDAQAANDYTNLLGRFEKRLHDLELTRMISIQMGPQIRLIQNNDSLMVEKIQTAIVNTIPLWKSQMVLALSMYNSEQAMAASHDVSEVTNNLLKQNAQNLHMGSVAVAKESERGIVDMETLTATNQELINTLEDVRQIQEDGRTRRAAAETELSRIEGELKAKLLQMRG